MSLIGRPSRLTGLPGLIRLPSLIRLPILLRLPDPD
jgi:hypothetical protein